ncbi:MAG: DUF86 domain-containing protein [Spirochaetes bacterium]|nr:DUF86 domain-containing protein [Spirochaetota bacterium]
MKNYKEFAKHIRDEIQFLMKHSGGLALERLISDQILLRAFIRSIEVIGEASKKIPDEVKARYPAIEWKKISGTRDVLIHHYFDIDKEILWDIVTNKIPALYEEIVKMIAEE